MTVALNAHLQTGVTGICHLWTLERRDGQVLGFTDHDCDLEVGGLIHHAGSGLTASALQLATGLAVDNSEAVGALSAALPHWALEGSQPAPQTDLLDRAGHAE